jgi:hypothetical protein
MQEATKSMKFAEKTVLAFPLGEESDCTERSVHCIEGGGIGIVKEQKGEVKQTLRLPYRVVRPFVDFQSFLPLSYSLFVIS